MKNALPQGLLVFSSALGLLRAKNQAKGIVNKLTYFRHLSNKSEVPGSGIFVQTRQARKPFLLFIAMAPYNESLMH
jgi:hypothetical protein